MRELENACTVLKATKSLEELTLVMDGWTTHEQMNETFLGHLYYHSCKAVVKGNFERVKQEMKLQLPEYFKIKWVSNSAGTFLFSFRLQDNFSLHVVKQAFSSVVTFTNSGPQSSHAEHSLHAWSSDVQTFKHLDDAMPLNN
jgi:hypothetical protein